MEEHYLPSDYPSDWNDDGSDGWPLHPRNTLPICQHESGLNVCSSASFYCPVSVLGHVYSDIIINNAF